MNPVRVVVRVAPRLGDVVPAAALPALRDGALLTAADDVPDALRAAAGAVPLSDVPDDAPAVLLAVDPTVGVAAEWVARGATLVESPQPSGAALLDAVAVMDRLRSPGGCPWDADQTHTSLLRYLVEETYEFYDAVEHGDRAAMREELGDVLLQVLFHARVAQEPADGFDVDAVAADLVEKLVSRHPHVFADAERVHTADDQQRRWDELKAVEKRRESSVDGVALGQPAVALAAKFVTRTARVGLPADLLPVGVDTGTALLERAAHAARDGEDPEAALRTAALRFGEAVRSAERSARAAGLDPAALTEHQWRAHWPVG